MAYIKPSWANGTSPYINAANLQAISDTLACVPVANGGTGATTAAEARTNLGVQSLANCTSKGSATTPVYFNASGVATAIAGPIPASKGGTGASSISSFVSANKIMTYSGSAVGSASTPVYINSSGVPVACSYDLVHTNATTSAAGLMSTADKVKLNAIGALVSDITEADKNILTSTFTNLCSISLPAGTWIIHGDVRFGSERGGGARIVGIALNTTTIAGNSPAYQATQVQAADTAAYCRLFAGAIVVPTATTTYYLNAYQSSGSTLSVASGYASMRAIRIA